MTDQTNCSDDSGVDAEEEFVQTVLLAEQSLSVRNLPDLAQSFGPGKYKLQHSTKVVTDDGMVRWTLYWTQNGGKYIRIGQFLAPPRPGRTNSRNVTGELFVGWDERGDKVMRVPSLGGGQFVVRTRNGLPYEIVSYCGVVF